MHPVQVQPWAWWAEAGAAGKPSSEQIPTLQQTQPDLYLQPLAPPGNVCPRPAGRKLPTPCPCCPSPSLRKQGAKCSPAGDPNARLKLGLSCPGLRGLGFPLQQVETCLYLEIGRDCGAGLAGITWASGTPSATGAGRELRERGIRVRQGRAAPRACSLPLPWVQPCAPPSVCHPQGSMADSWESPLAEGAAQSLLVPQAAIHSSRPRAMESIWGPARAGAATPLHWHGDCCPVEMGTRPLASSASCLATRHLVLSGDEQNELL